jgi:hypothetical protein
MEKYCHKATTEIRDERRAQARKAVEDGIKALLEKIKAGKIERLVQWLDFCAHFNKDCPANQFLIAEQCRLAGAGQTIAR